MKILVAEDEPMMLKTIALRLQKDGHEIFTAVDGKEAIEILHLVDPDLVITDIMMPYVSGLEIVSLVKKQPKKIPVIVLSSMGQEKVVLEAFDLGADDYMTKPFSPHELTVRVRKLTM